MAPFGRAVHEEVSPEAGAGGRGLWESQRLPSVRMVRGIWRKRVDSLRSRAVARVLNLDSLRSSLTGYDKLLSFVFCMFLIN